MLKKELQTLGEKTEEYLAGWKRAAADYQNLQKETARDRETMVRFASEHLLRDLLPVLDHAKAAFGQMPETDNEMIKQWLAGAKHVFDGLKKTLKAHGLEEMPVMGEKFDPGRYETVGSRKEDGKEAGLVLEEARPGYLLHGKVLRPAQVIISE
ncbi:nucleotide exchange factor GrpE [Candidatus Uhrbacteria bacterium]|nr:nucleotide exchange factor GrpE [Candidatus Uhrbacteria bacterium]